MLIFPPLNKKEMDIRGENTKLKPKASKLHPSIASLKRLKIQQKYSCIIDKYVYHPGRIKLKIHQI